MTALQNQLGKLNSKEMEVYTTLITVKGLTGEEALSFVLTAAAINLI